MAITLSRDSAGWTIFTPTADSRIMYVSNTGNDGTGTVYDYNDFADPFNPGSVNAFLTYAAANAQARDGYPDWILFERGGTFSCNLTPKYGKDSDEFALTAWYGSSGASPLLKPETSGSQMIDMAYEDCDYTAIVGLTFYATRRDPGHPDYVGDTGSYGLYGEENASFTATQVLIEGCVFKYFKYQSFNNLAATGGSWGFYDFVVRRCVFLHTWSDAIHSTGLWLGNPETMVLEECIFDHCGWYTQSPGTPGTATYYNHNVYCFNPHNVTMSKNIFARASSMAVKFTHDDASNVTVDDNLILDGEIGLSIGGNANTPLRFDNFVVTDNVFTEIGRSNPINRQVAWYITASDWDGGEIKRNLFLHTDSSSVSNLSVLGQWGGCVNTEFSDNVFYNLNASGLHDTGQWFDVEHYHNGVANTKSGLVFSNNKIQAPSGQNARLISFDEADDVSTYTFTNNIYYSDNASTAFYVEGTTEAFAAWATRSGETGSWAQYSFLDSTRSIETYMQSLGETATIDAFITKIRAMDRFNWDTDYTAETVNAWLRAGFFEQITGAKLLFVR